ncbi:hypothetical protein A6V39_02225 [Candidatus Mycoplasma haematobovis]|uniref:Spermidine/putrescine ABC transporter substrate-binding protein n=1 Tax=Candidatus Mycoplasma haematobovis TaxID=432608 RepID=A0A1A9QDC1_9MOLU|nr:spermidine/putrescine ABC transporter substrate-binding protein [Candidatus Mycoplasma haematobovis]OAL10238.1 hypothetical protein A6V39_02225 [Candidatus Mycoplasma haematobovis]
MIKKLTISLTTWVAASSGLLLGKSSNSNDLVFGNYSDYISSNVAQELREKYQLRVDLFDYDHLVKERFQKGIYDIAITSTSVLSELKSSGAALKLDWSRLLGNGTNDGNVGRTESNVSETGNSKTVEDARKLFTEIVQDMSQDLLEYGIPYFIQKLGFYYRGEEIAGLKDQQPVTFSKLIEEISKDDRFKSKDGKPKIGLIDDPRTVLSLARKVAGKQDVNPKESEYSSSEAILKDYRTLINKGLSIENLGNNFLLMSPDSGTLVDALSSKSIEGAFMYNGDGYFASEGGNAKEEINEKDFHYVNLSENIYFLDFLTFSSKMSPDKQEKAYGLAKKLIFIGNTEEPFKKQAKQEGEEEAKYEEMAIRNFDYVGYTPTLQSVYGKLYKYLNDEDDTSETEDTLSSTEDESVKWTKKHEILKVEKPKTGTLSQEYERQLDSQQKNDMLIAYSNFKLLV